MVKISLFFSSYYFKEKTLRRFLVENDYDCLPRQSVLSYSTQHAILGFSFGIFSSFYNLFIKLKGPFLTDQQQNSVDNLIFGCLFSD